MTLTNLVFDQPVLNSSYECSVKHWDLTRVDSRSRDSEVVQVAKDDAKSRS